MLLATAFKTTSSTKATRRSAGLTLIEYLVGVAIGGIVLMVVVPLSVYSGRNFAGLANYSDLNTSGVYALDQMTKDIRQASGLTGYTTNQLTFSTGSNQPALIFTYDATNRTLVRQLGASSKTLLKGCDSLSFAIYQRTPIPGTYDQYPVANATNCKVVAVNWSCSRKILGSKVNSENAQSAKIVIRKH